MEGIKKLEIKIKSTSALSYERLLLKIINISRNIACIMNQADHDYYKDITFLVRTFKIYTAKTKNNSDLPTLSKSYDTFELQMAKSFMGNSVSVIGALRLKPLFGSNILREGANEKETKKFKNFLNIMVIIHDFKLAY